MVFSIQKLLPLDIQVGINTSVFKSKKIPAKLCAIPFYLFTRHIDSMTKPIDSQPAVDPYSLNKTTRKIDLMINCIKWTLLKSV